jgi:hypothetical protein
MVASPPTIPATAPAGPCRVPACRCRIPTVSARPAPALFRQASSAGLLRAASRLQTTPASTCLPGNPSPPGLVVRNVQVRPSDPEIRVP